MVHRSELLTPPPHGIASVTSANLAKDYDETGTSSSPYASAYDPLTQRLWKVVEQHVGEYEKRMKGARQTPHIPEKFPEDIKTLQTLTQAVRDLCMMHVSPLATPLSQSMMGSKLQSERVSASPLCLNSPPVMDEGHFPRDIDALRKELAQCLAHLRVQPKA
jgi:hypothetical protein